MRVKQSMIYWLLMVFASLSFADPIEDVSMKNYRAGWYPNFYHGEGPLSCPKTCSAWVGARSEHEKSNKIDGQTEMTNVCKVTRNPKIIIEAVNDPSSHWLYGNQFDDWAQCHVKPIGFEAFSSPYYMCLCVDKNECDKADLVLTKIHDPIWDHGTGQSVVHVTVTNNGSVDAIGFETSLTDPGTGATSNVFTANLAPGNSVVLTFYFNYWVFDPDAELIGVTDIFNDVDECDEDNNKLRYFKLG